MLRNIIIFLSLCVFVLAQARPTQDDFHACYEKNKASIVDVNGSLGIAIAPHLIAVPKDGDKVPKDFIKFDPYLKLYLVRSQKELQPPVMADETNENQITKSTWVGVLSDDNNTLMGHIKSFGSNLNEFDILSFDSNSTGELVSACCKMVGIAVGGDRFIPNRYLKHFAKYNDVYYGDIGVKFIQDGDKFVVSEVDPVGRGNALKPKDEIISIDSKSPTNLREINEAILFSPKDKLLKFLVSRDSEKLVFNVPVFSSRNATSANTQRSNDIEIKIDSLPSDYVSNDNSILKDYGIEIDKNLFVKKVLPKTNAETFGIKKGDKVLQVGDERVKNLKELQKAIGTKIDFTLLLNRGSFDYFIRVNP